MMVKTICKLFAVTYGLLAGLVGIIAILTAALLTYGATFEQERFDQSGGFFLYIFILAMADILTFFGIASALHGARCLLGPVRWIVRAHEFFWTNVMRNIVLLFGALMAFGIIYGLIQKFFM